MKINLLSTKSTSTVGVNNLANISRWSSNLIQNVDQIFSPQKITIKRNMCQKLIFMHTITQSLRRVNHFSY